MSMLNKSFADILAEKMADSPLKETPSAYFTIAEPYFHNLNIDLNISFFPSAKRAAKAYPREKFQKDEPSPVEKAPERESDHPVNWSFSQQLALQQLIQLGGNIQLTSSYDDVKKAYRQLINRYHPDRHQNKDPLALSQMSEKLQAVVECFRLFEQDI